MNDTNDKPPAPQTSGASAREWIIKWHSQGHHNFLLATDGPHVAPDEVITVIERSAYDAAVASEKAMGELLYKTQINAQEQLAALTKEIKSAAVQSVKLMETKIERLETEIENLKAELAFAQEHPCDTCKAERDRYKAALERIAGDEIEFDEGAAAKEIARKALAGGELE